MFKKLFGGGAPQAAPAPQPTTSSAEKTIASIQKLQENEESLEKRKALLEKRVEAEVERAKQFAKQQKKAQALQCLKKKKLLETEVANLENMIMRVTEQRIMLEGQRTTVETVATMHNAAKAAKDNMNAMKIENVDKVLDEINEVSDQMRQIQDVFNAPLGMGTDMDEDELLNELEEMQASQLDEELLAPAPVPTTKVPGAAEKLPSVPAGRAAAKVPAKSQEELELEALQAEMAL